MNLMGQLALVLASLLFTLSAVAADKDGVTVSKVAIKSNQPQSIIVDFKIPEFKVEPAESGMSAIKVDGLSPVTEIGKPALFTTGRLVYVPEGYRPEVKVLGSKVAMQQDVLVKPFQNKLRCSGKDVYEFNKKLYASAASYPADVVSLEDLGWMQGHRLARIGITPFVQDFKNKGLKVTTELALEISFVKDNANRSSFATTPTFDRLVAGAVVNTEDMPAASTDFVQEGLLIVSADSLVSTLDSYVQWKRQKGYKVEVVTYTQAGGSRDRVTTFIKQYYDQAANHLTYVLLVGNGTTMPPHRRGTSSGSAASDYPFSLVAGSDNLPDILMGRVVANNETEANAVLSRAIDHEKIGSDNDWLSEGLTIASDEGSSPSDEEYAGMIHESLKANTYTYLDNFLQGDGNATATNITAALEDGRSWLTYFGHGSGTSWGSTNGTFNTSTIDRIENQGKLPVIVDVACTNGSFVDINRCFGKAWVTHQVDGVNAGAVGYYGASVSTSWDPPAIMATGIAKYHYEKSLHHLAASLVAGQIYLVEQDGMNSSTQDNLEWYNLFGDPTLVMRTASPVAYTVETAKQGADLSIRAVDAQGVGVAGLTAVVTAAQDNAFMGGAVTNADGIAVIPVDSLNNAQLTLTGYNKETVQMGLAARH